MLISLISAKGSPGVTTTAAALAAVGVDQRGAQGWPPQSLDLVELDPAGGDIEPLTGLTGESGLLRAAEDLRPETLIGYAVDAPPGVRSLLAPTSGMEAYGTVMAALEAWGPVLSSVGGVVVADAGRWERSQASARRLAGSDVAVIVCRPDTKGIEHVRHIVEPVRALVRPAPVVLATVGDRPYRLAEVAEALRIHPAGTLAWDPKGAAGLWVEGAGPRKFRNWGSSFLARSARSLLEELTRVATGVPTR